MNDKKVKRLLSLGGKLWEKSGKSRLYFNDLDALYGLKVARRKSGTISSATLDGEEISNGEAGRLLAVFSEMKIWYDLTESQFYYRAPGSSRYDTDEMAKGLIEKLSQACDAISDEEASELPQIERPPTLLDHAAKWCEKYGVTLPPELTLLTQEELAEIPSFFHVRNNPDPKVYIHITEEPEEPDDEYSEYFIYALEAHGEKAYAYRYVHNTTSNLQMAVEVNLLSFQRENIWRIGRPGMVTGRYDRDLGWTPRSVREELVKVAGVDKPIAPIGVHGISWSR